MHAPECTALRGDPLSILKFDRQHWTLLKIATGRCHFLTSPGDIGLFQNRQELKKIVTETLLFLKIDGRHWEPLTKGPTLFLV